MRFQRCQASGGELIRLHVAEPDKERPAHCLCSQQGWQEEFCGLRLHKFNQHCPKAGLGSVGARQDPQGPVKFRKAHQLHAAEYEGFHMPGIGAFAIGQEMLAKEVRFNTSEAPAFGWGEHLEATDQLENGVVAGILEGVNGL